MAKTRKQTTDEPTTKPPLPEGWKWFRFDELAINVNDRIDDPSLAGVSHYVGLDHLDSDSLKIRRWGTPDEVEAQKLRFRKGDIIFGKRRAYQRKVGVADFDGICSAHAMVLRGNAKNLVPELLPFFMQTDAFMDRAVAISKGSLSPTINWPDLARQQFAMPANGTEQERCSVLLAQADTTRESYRSALADIEKVESAFISEVVLSSRHGGEMAAIGDDADIAYGLTVNADRRELEEERPYLRVANVQRNSLDLSEVKCIGATSADLASFALYNRDILVVEGHADPTEIGRAAMWHGEIKECLHQNHILRIRCGESWVPEYVLMYLNSFDGCRYFRRHAKSSSGLYTINSSVLRNIRLPRLNLPTQIAVVERFQGIETRRAALTDHLTRLEAVKKRLLTHLLTQKVES